MTDRKRPERRVGLREIRDRVEEHATHRLDEAARVVADVLVADDHEALRAEPRLLLVREALVVQHLAADVLHRVVRRS